MNLKDFIQKNLIGIPTDLYHIYEYFIISAELLEASKEIEKLKQYDSSIDKFLELQIKELILRKEITSSETKDKIAFAIEKMELSKEIKEVLSTISKLDKLNPNFTLDVFIDFSKSLGNDNINLLLKNIKMLNNIDFTSSSKIDTNAKLANLLNGRNIFNNIPQDFKEKYINTILEQEHYTNSKTEQALSIYAKKYNKELPPLGVSENQKAWIAFFSKTLVESQSKLSIQEYMKEFKEEHGIANAAIDELVNLKPKDFSELYSGISNLDILVLPNELNNILNGMLIKHIDKLTNIIDTINSLSPAEVIKSLEGLYEGFEGLVDGSTGGYYSVGKFVLKMIPHELKMKNEVYAKIYNFKENKIKEISELIKDKFEPMKKVQNILIQHLGVIAETQKNIGKNLSNQKSTNIVNVISKIGEQDFEIKKSINLNKKGFVDFLKNDALFPDKKEQEYLISIYIDKMTPDIKKLEKILIPAFEKMKDSNKDEYEHFENLAAMSNGVKFNKTIQDRIEREIFINYLLNQTDLNSLPNKKRNIYLDSLIGRNDVDSKTIYSKDPFEDYNLKLTFLNQTLKDIEDRKTNKLYSKDKIEIMEEAISLLKNIINIERHINYGMFDIITDKNDRKKYIEDTFIDISTIKNKDNPIIKSLLEDNRNKLNTLNNNKEIDFNKYVLKEKLIDKIIDVDKSKQKEWNNYEILTHKQSNMPTTLQKEFYNNDKISIVAREQNSIFGDLLGKDSNFLAFKNEKLTEIDFIKGLKTLSQKEYNKELLSTEVNHKLHTIANDTSLISKNNKFLMSSFDSLHDVILIALRKSKQYNIIGGYENANNIIDTYMENPKIKSLDDINKNIQYLMFVTQYDSKFNPNFSVKMIDDEFVKDDTLLFSEPNNSNSIFGLKLIEEYFDKNDISAFEIIKNKLSNIEAQNNDVMNSLNNKELELISKSSVMKLYFIEFFISKESGKGQYLNEENYNKLIKMIESAKNPKISFLDDKSDFIEKAFTEVKNLNDMN